MPEPPTAEPSTPDGMSDRALFARAATDEARLRRARPSLPRAAAPPRRPLRRRRRRRGRRAGGARQRQPRPSPRPRPGHRAEAMALQGDDERGDRPSPGAVGAAPRRPAHEDIDLDALLRVAGRRPARRPRGPRVGSRVVTGIQELSPNQRRAATARFLEGRSHDEIADELGVTKGAARELISRARRNLRDAIPGPLAGPALHQASRARSPRCSAAARARRRGSARRRRGRRRGRRGRRRRGRDQERGQRRSGQAPRGEGRPAPVTTIPRQRRSRPSLATSPPRGAAGQPPGQPGAASGSANAAGGSAGIRPDARHAGGRLRAPRPRRHPPRRRASGGSGSGSQPRSGRGRAGPGRRRGRDQVDGGDRRRQRPGAGSRRPARRRRAGPAQRRPGAGDR